MIGSVYTTNSRPLSYLIKGVFTDYESLTSESAQPVRIDEFTIQYKASDSVTAYANNIVGVSYAERNISG